MHSVFKSGWVTFMIARRGNYNKENNLSMTLQLHYWLIVKNAKGFPYNQYTSS